MMILFLSKTNHLRTLLQSSWLALYTPFYDLHTIHTFAYGGTARTADPLPTGSNGRPADLQPTRLELPTRCPGRCLAAAAAEMSAVRASHWLGRC